MEAASSYNLLVRIIDDNINCFETVIKYENIVAQLRKLKICVEDSFEKIEKIESFASEYDFDEYTPANGYRSFVEVWTTAVKKSTKVCGNLRRTQNSIFLWENYYKK